jgi:Asp-tRNA(Asn)/Glu-tRNA(Gln) amidotransferase A subunit family amidase
VTDSNVNGLDARLDRIDAREPVLRALVEEEDRRGRLLREEVGLTPGPLHGLFAGIKDIFHADGLVTGAGTRLPRELFAREREAEAVAALRAAGCRILGKTVTTEFAYFEPGPTTNPHNPAHTPGGSSSGSAAAVAAGYCEVALGTQTVGSVIRPAAFCGIVGVKPSYGRVSTDGLLLCSVSVDTVGWFAADVAMAARLVPALLGEAVPASPARTPRLAVPAGPYLEQGSADGLRAFGEQVARLRDGGCEVVEVPALTDIAEINSRHGDLQAGEMAREHAAWMEDYLSAYRPRTRELLLRGRAIPESRLQEARSGRERLRRCLTEALDAAGAELWLCPSAPGPAPEGLASTGDPVMNLPWTHAGLPAVSLPAGQVGGLPVGLQCVGRFGMDAPLLAWAAVLERYLAD